MEFVFVGIGVATLALTVFSLYRSTTQRTTDRFDTNSEFMHGIAAAMNEKHGAHGEALHKVELLITGELATLSSTVDDHERRLSGLEGSRRPWQAEGTPPNFFNRNGY